MLTWQGTQTRAYVRHLVRSIRLADKAGFHGWARALRLALADHYSNRETVT